MTFTSTFCPGLNVFVAGVPCGRPVSEFGMRPVRPVSRRTNTPNGATFSTWPATTEPSGIFSASPSHGSLVESSRSVRERRRCSSSISRTQPETSWPTATDGSFRSTPGGSWETWTRPSMPGSISMKRPKSACRATALVKAEPGGILWARPSQGSFSSSFMEREIRFPSFSTFVTLTWTSCPTVSASLACATLRREISVTWTSPSTPPRSTKAPKSVIERT